MWCKSDPVVSRDVLCWKKFPLFLVILNVLCLFFGFSVLSYLFLDHTCLYKKELVFLVKWRDENGVFLLTEWPHIQHMQTHLQTNWHVDPVVKSWIPQFYRHALAVSLLQIAWIWINCSTLRVWLQLAETWFIHLCISNCKKRRKKNDKSLEEENLCHGSLYSAGQREL